MKFFENDLKKHKTVVRILPHEYDPENEEAPDKVQRKDESIAGGYTRYILAS